MGRSHTRRRAQPPRAKRGIITLAQFVMMRKLLQKHAISAQEYFEGVLNGTITYQTQSSRDKAIAKASRRT